MPRLLIDRNYPYILRLLGIIIFWIAAVPRLTLWILRRGEVLFEQSFTLPLILLVRLCLRKKCIVDDMILLHLGAHPAAKWLWLSFDNLTAVLCDRIVTAAPRTAAYLHRRFVHKRVLFLPNGCDLLDLPEISSRAECGSTIRAILTGSMTFTQNRIAVLNVMRISSLIRGRVANLVLEVVGGPMSEVRRIQCTAENAGDLVHFAGPVSEQALKKKYYESSVGLLPFFDDTPLIGGSRTKALEYLAHGLLVISGPEGMKGLPYLKPAIHYISTANIDEFADALVRAVVNLDQYHEMRESAYRLVRSKYAWNELAKEIVAFIA